MPMQGFNNFERIPAVSNDVAQILGDQKPIEREVVMTHWGLVLEARAFDSRTFNRETW